MKIAKLATFLVALLAGVLGVVVLSPITNAQNNKEKSVPQGPLLTRTTTRRENRRFAYGGTVTIVGAPAGSISIQGWDRNEVDVVADIELHAFTAEDLAKVTLVNNFVFDEDTNHIRIMTTGVHDRSLMKRLGKNFPKGLSGLPWKIDYRIKVPSLTDLEINGGVGAIKLAGVEGALHLNALESDATLWLTGGDAIITVQKGAVYLGVPARGWHGLGLDLKLAVGNLAVELPVDFSAEINASVLRLGKVEVAYPNLESRERNSMGPNSVRARAGSGGATLSFTVGDGTISIKQMQ